LQGFWLRVTVDWKIWQLRLERVSDDELLQLREAMFATRDGSVTDLVAALPRNRMTRAKD